ncbi:hypothetical protein BV22DRAFT_1026915 [Leucogyrophana mollusca]|uniref:Uncharacterized protein n=1 Tax=Leucogyrophana mollusca TaxID=85980 RepID=A0ACB8AWB0_9AGAM|nr:hypothetical protein BV22DRAFT_1026915 [Leucogyrophana mollusca]
MPVSASPPGSRASSPALSESSIGVHGGRRQRPPRSGLHRTVSLPLSGNDHPIIHVGEPPLTSQLWSVADQSDFEAMTARIMASAGLPLRWIENPEWISFCQRFFPAAKVPSTKVLTKRILPHVLRGLKTTAKEECVGADATLQCDGWTGENNHHLIGFMMTANQKLHTVRVHDASSDPQTADELLKQILIAINTIEDEWKASVVACTSDDAGEARKARRLLREQKPHLVVPHCYAHQVRIF